MSNGCTSNEAHKRRAVTMRRKRRISLQIIYENLLWGEDMSVRVPKPLIGTSGRVAFPKYFGPGLYSIPHVEPEARVTSLGQNMRNNVLGQVEDALRVHSQASSESLSPSEMSTESNSLDGDTYEHDRPFQEPYVVEVKCL